MNDDEQCPVCGRRRILKKVCYDPNSVFYECPVCGQYEYSMENSTYEELDYNELAPFLFYEGFRNKQGRVEHRYYSTKSRESCDTYTTEFKMVITLLECRFIWIKILFHCGFQKVFLKK